MNRRKTKWRNDVNPVEAVQSLLVEGPDSVLPDPDLVSYYILEKERKIYFEQDVDNNIMALHRMILRWNIEDKDIPVENRMPIKLYIFSYGGESDYMWSIIDEIKASKTPVYTINTGIAASAASMIFVAGHKRFMFPSSEVIIHQGSAEFAGDAVKVIDATDSYKKLLEKMKQFYLENTNIPKAHLNKKRNNDWHLDSKYCLEHGVCHQIVESLDEVI